MAREATASSIFAGERVLRFERTEHFDVPPEDLWPYVSNTRRINKEVGLPEMRHRAQPSPGGGTRVFAEYRMLGIPIARWEEHPFDWEVPRRHAVRREYTWGPVKRFWGGAELTPRDGGTDLRLFAEIVPRSVLTGPLVWLANWKSGVGRAMEGARRYVAALPKRPAATAAPRAGLEGRVGALADEVARTGVDRALVDRLCAHLVGAPDDEVVKMRPFELARRWGWERREVLGLFLHATTAGLVTMSWDILCPNCRISKRESTSLRSLETSAHCEVCNITFDATFDRLIETRFTVARTIRPVPDRPYCIGGPSNTPHIVAQAALQANATETVGVWIADAGEYRIRSPQCEERGRLVARDGATPVPIALEVHRDRLAPATIEAPTGLVELTIANRTGGRLLVSVEGKEWSDTAATAAVVSSFQEFRDLFSSEVLAPGLLLGIERQTFLFTDLSGSTAMYEAVGQARAFRIVQDQFDVLRAAVARYEGAVVKTIGDAVMATFHSPEHAVAAAIDMQRDIQRLDVSQPVDTRRFLKVGIHQGPCVAVTQNDRLDYFGTTVNTAARVEHECKGGEVLITEDVYADPLVRRFLEAADFPIESEPHNLRGLKMPIRLYHFRPVLPS